MRPALKILLACLLLLPGLACSLSAAQPANPTPLSPTPTGTAGSSPVQGSIEVAPGDSVIGGFEGSRRTVTIVFSANSTQGRVTKMRLDDGDWEAFVPEKEVEIIIPLNWSSLRRCVVYQDEAGSLSAQYCDSKGVEGHPQAP